MAELRSDGGETRAKMRNMVRQCTIGFRDRRWGMVEAKRACGFKVFHRLVSKVI